jgi:hypothetical protein
MRIIDKYLQRKKRTYDTITPDTFQELNWGKNYVFELISSNRVSLIRSKIIQGDIPSGGLLNRPRKRGYEHPPS